ncbi:uncharacterized protein TRIADDRAFT_56260 [Trichoplax adhaerens]|uniref:Las1-like protein n=1 Tax=Trichoplax adhaerens TaxID=10228 RepID=B3RXM4_TRIAD|nr:hypothetical protein TRIADDRAFT_56260 [Trichoplax adhaerens]EDV24453.1 hypothetical protein TRIADDRAFT_56260 [Trichoplax adhaerens]|eukprot:XP_002112343.1 hypothetical protein TRIADDRAFT_56260 [Trichoplax adhaerens]
MEAQQTAATVRLTFPNDRLVGWRDKQEWLQVFNWLFSNEWSLQERGIERVAAWKSKRNEKLPLAIECTIMLIRAYLNDVYQLVDPLSARLTYSMSLVRFINSMTDLMQNKLYARPISYLANTIGLPDWLVDVRHEATHAGLPSLDVLRTACNVALDWLRTQYWESQLVSFQETEDFIAQSLEKYWLEQVEVVISKSKKKKRTSPTAISLINKIKKRVTCDDIIETMIPMLTKSDFFIPTLANLKRLNLDHTRLNCKATHKESTLPDELIYVWEPMLLELQTAFQMFLPHLITEILTQLDEENEDGNPSRAFIITAWIRYIFNQISEGKFIINGSLPIWWTVLKTILRFPDLLSLEITKRLFQLLNPEPNEKFKQQIVNLISIYLRTRQTDTTEDNQIHTDKEEYTPNQLTDIWKTNTNKLLNNECSHFRSWKRCEGNYTSPQLSSN